MSNYYGALVSAIITTHNRADLLPRAIDSVLGQTYPNLEIVIVDDGSSDDTERVVRAYRDKYDRIRYHRFCLSRGACAARNFGIKVAKGEFVTGLDDDDEWMPKRVETLLINYRDEYAYICSRDCIIYSEAIEYKKVKSVITFNDMLYSNVTGNQVFTKRERILNVGGFDEKLSSGQDYDLWLRLVEKYGDAKMIPEPLQKVYRDHPRERISASRDKVRGEWRVYNKHKDKMTRDQRIVHLLELKRLKAKKLTLAEISHAINTGYFTKYLKYYLRKRRSAIFH